RLCRVPAGHPQGYQDAFDAFIADSYAVFAGEQREGVPRLADGLRAVTVTEAVLRDRKSTRLNSSHVSISYAVFCLKKKINDHTLQKLYTTYCTQLKPEM